MTNRAAPWLGSWPAAALLLLAMSPVQAASNADPPQIDYDDGKVYAHFIEPRPRVTTAWEDLTEDSDELTWTFNLTIDEQGTVRSAEFKSGPRSFRGEAQRAALAFRFKPFLRDGQPAAVRLQVPVWSQPSDYGGPADRAFPANPDPSTIVIALKRTACYGTCPDYRVELRGNGEVTFRGNRFVLVKGVHKWRIDPATVKPLLDLFRRANYFDLAGYYESGVTDNPTYITRFSVNGLDKYVLDYVGEDQGMPPIVTEIEGAIDTAARTASWIDGDEHTMQRLREIHWNFRTNDAGHGLRKLLSDCKTTLAREFVLAGAPVSVVGKDDYSGGVPISLAAHCGDIELVRLLIAKGALERKSHKDDFLWSSATSGFPEMLALALARTRNVNLKDSEGGPLLSAAAGSYADDDNPNASRFDSAKVIEMLIDAGANPNVSDDVGKTPLFEANSAAVAATLIRKGADPNARDRKGQTALFDPYFAEPKNVLIAAGTDVNARDNFGATALFYQSYLDSIKLLLDAGADVNAVDLKGRTAIESIDSEDGIAALLAAGARLPTDPERLKALIATATRNRWTELLRRFEAAAAGK
jgi:ankyrin repeat protein